MKIAIGSDHGGYKLKEALMAYLIKNKNQILDIGTFSRESCDYPEFADKVTEMVLTRKAKIGILACKSGIGMSIAANRKKGIRAALCYNIKAAKLSREHNNANVLVLGSNFSKTRLIERICDAFIKTDFVGGRHARRNKKIDNIKK